MVKRHPLNFRIPSEEELGLKPLDLPPIFDIEKYCEKMGTIKKEKDPLNFRILSDEELGLNKPLDLRIDPLPPMQEIKLDSDFDLRKYKFTLSPVDEEHQ